MKEAISKIAYPPRIDLARLPTPLRRLHRFGERVGVELYVKRDDLTTGGIFGLFSMAAEIEPLL